MAAPPSASSTCTLMAVVPRVNDTLHIGLLTAGAAQGEAHNDFAVFRDVAGDHRGFASLRPPNR